MKMKAIFDYFDEMGVFIDNHEWSNLEEYAYNLVIRLSGGEIATEIMNLSFHDIQKHIKEELIKAVDYARKQKAAAIYYEYDVDNDWSGYFFICDTYLPRKKISKGADEDWACYFHDVTFKTLEYPLLTKVYERNGGFDQTQKAIGSTVYLVAKTVSAFGRAFNDVECSDLAICMGFHEQYPIIRIQEHQPSKNKLFDPRKSENSLPAPIELSDIDRYMLHNYGDLVMLFKKENNIKEQIKKVLEVYKNEIYLNYCPFCGALRRGPLAKQCPNCYKRE